MLSGGLASARLCSHDAFPSRNAAVSKRGSRSRCKGSNRDLFRKLGICRDGRVTHRHECPSRCQGAVASTGPAPCPDSEMLIPGVLAGCCCCFLRGAIEELLRRRERRNCDQVLRPLFSSPPQRSSQRRARCAGRGNWEQEAGQPQQQASASVILTTDCISSLLIATTPSPLRAPPPPAPALLPKA